jgi:membrane protease YdiL (CAAX protease family)
VPPELLARAASFDPAARIAAVTSLAALATPAALDLLAVMLTRDIDPRVRAWAATALGASRNPDFVPALEMAARADPDPAVRAAAEAAARAVGPFARRPKAAAGFSVLCPGCGYFYLREPARAIAFLGAAGALLGAALVVRDQTPVDATGEHPDGRALPLEMAIQELWFYGIFASYRDARLARDDAGARFPVAREHLPELVVAPFNPHILKSPYVWAGLPALIGAAVGYTYLVSRFVSLDNGPATRTLGDPGGVTFFGHHYGTAAGLALGSGYNATLYDMVAVGEESLFRGVVQAGLSETSLGLWGGWALGSAIFGSIHAFNFIGEEQGFKNAAVAVPYIALTGSYLGYVFIKKNFSLLTGVAIHFWYDFALATIDFISDPDHQPFVARVSFPF